ncbi:MAG TPA: lipase family protein, partial [Intrasporangium sp.]|nr:lipase family protein [Intrasporangium sp.]
MGDAPAVTLSERAVGRLPRWAAVTLGVVASVVGVVLATRPFRSLAVLFFVVVLALVVSGVVDLATPAAARQRWLSLVRGLVQVAAALALLLWPGPGLRVITALAALALVVAGGTALVEGAQTAGPARWAGFGVGFAQVVLGVLALSWRDVAVVVVAFAFGVRLVVFGVRIAWGGRRSQASSSAGQPPRRWRVAMGISAAIGSVLLALISVLVQRDAPQVDAFYAAPDSVPTTPGQLLRSEPFDRDIPAGSTAWRILYTTTRDDGVPAVASAIVVAPVRAEGPTPVVAWAHGTTGWATGCAPSVLEHPFEAGALFSLDSVIEKGWTLVATDYVGLGTEGSHPYLIGEPVARSVLDSVRAAHQLDAVNLAESTVVWGHSQGGHAALWTGMLAGSYAPELEIAGVAALAPASNLAGLVDVVGSIRVGSLFGAYVVQAYTDAYADVSYDDYVRPGAQVIVREMAARCLSERGVIVSIATALLLDQPVWRQEPTT